MKFRKIIAFVFVSLIALFLVACGKEENKNTKDPYTPTAIAIKVKTAKVQINKTLSLTYTITPATAQEDNVTVTLNNNLATATKKNSKTVDLTAGNQEGTVKVTITTSNGISASKTIKIQIEEVENYPDLSGYTIKIANAEHALGEYDVRLTKETEEKYGFYTEADREEKIRAIEEIEDNYNCSISFVAYPSDAPWGPSRWNYILTQAQNEAPEYDFYIVESKQIPSFVGGNAIIDLTDWYAEYGKNTMNDMSITSSTYKGHIYAFAPRAIKIQNILGYNIGLLKEIQQQDPSIKEPAQMYLDGEWTYSNFLDYCKSVQTALRTMHGEETYYCLSGYGCYYWRGMVNAAGIKVIDNVGLEVSISGTTEAMAAQTLQDIYAFGAMDPAFQGDGGVSSWNNQRSLFNTGSLWFVNAQNRWGKDQWGEGTTQYGYVPFPTSDSSDRTYIGTHGDGFFVMSTGREWAYEGYGSDCTAENIYRAFVDYYATGKQYYESNEDYNRVTEQTNYAMSIFSSEASVQAFVKITCGTANEQGVYEGGLDDIGFFDPFTADIVLEATGGNGTFAGAVNNFIKGTGGAQWTDAVASFEPDIKAALVELYG